MLFMARDNLKLPENPSGVTDLAIQQHMKLKREIEENCGAKINSGERFSITTDEWTSGSGHRWNRTD